LKEIHVDSVRNDVILLTKVAQNSMLNWLSFECSSPINRTFKRKGTKMKTKKILAGIIQEKPK